MEKIFCIGFQKTGTTSFKQAMTRLGYSVCTTEDRRRAMKSILEGNYSTVVPEVISKYDVFEDNPWFWPYIETNNNKSIPTYEWIYNRYPNSRFVLTRRKSSEAWLKSFMGHIKRFFPSTPISDSEKYIFIYGKERLRNNLPSCVEIYEDYNKEAIKFFSDKPHERFLEIAFDSGQGWIELCGFLNKPVPQNVPFPHANKKKKTNFLKEIKKKIFSYVKSYSGKVLG